MCHSYFSRLTSNSLRAVFKRVFSSRRIVVSNMGGNKGLQKNMNEIGFVASWVTFPTTLSVFRTHLLAYLKSAPTLASESPQYIAKFRMFDTFSP